MLTILRTLARNISTLILAFALAVAVWISAISAADPVIEQQITRPITLEITGLSPDLLITNTFTRQVTVTIKAPRSLWNELNTAQSQISAAVDLANYSAGQYTLPVDVKVGLKPAVVTRTVPADLDLTLDSLDKKMFSIKIDTRGEPATGFKAGLFLIDPLQVEVSGPASQVGKVAEVRIFIDISQAKESVKQVLSMNVLDANGNPVNGLTLLPDKVTITIPITQRGDYRTVVVKVVLNGQVATGYRLTNIIVNPPAVTVFSSDPRVVENLPGYIETVPLNINGAKDDLDLQVALNLPENVELVDQQTVNVQISIAAIEGGLTLTDMAVTTTGLGPNLHAKVSPVSVDVILTGPLNLLDKLTLFNIRVEVDLTGRGAGIYQLAPRVVIGIGDIRVESVLPASIEVTIIEYTPTPVFTPTITPTPTRTPTITPTPTPRP